MCFFFFLDVELHELFVNFEHESPVSRIICKFFSHSVGCLFIVFAVSFAVQKLLSLIRCHLFFVLFCFNLCCSRRLKNVDAIYVSVLPMFSSVL